MNRINRVTAPTGPSFLKQYLFGLLIGSIFALSLPLQAMIEPEQAEPAQELVPAIAQPDMPDIAPQDIARPAIAKPDIAQRVIRANFLIKELYYKNKVNHERLLEQPDRRKLRRILQEQPYPKSAILHTILIALSNGEFEAAHQAIQEANDDKPDLSDFTLKDLKAKWVQAAIRAAVSHTDFNFLEQESTPEILHESRTGHNREMRRRSREKLERAAQEEQIVQEVTVQSEREHEEENKAREEKLAQSQAQEEQELEQASALSREQEEQRIAAEQRAELEAKHRAEQAAELKARIKKEKKAKKEREEPPQELTKAEKKQRLLSQQEALQRSLDRLETERDQRMALPAGLTNQEIMAYLSQKSDREQNAISAIGNQIGKIKDNMVLLGYELEKLEYPDNVTQYRLVPQKNNDCGFRSARHAVLGYMHATGKIGDKDFADAIEVDEDAILSINDLENLVKPDPLNPEDSILVFPRPPDPNSPGQTLQDYATRELELEKIVAVACQWPKLGTDAIDASNVTILPLILGIRNPEYQFIYAYTDAVRATIKQMRSNADFVHAFIVNADQSVTHEPRVTHWLPIIVKKENGEYSYTILDSLNKGRLELVQDLIYLIEQFNQPE